MPPRYAYWTIIVDDQPTAFRAGALDDIMPTFNRLKEKQPTAKLMWFQSGKLWPSRIDAREAMQVRGERGRYSDPRQDGGDKTPSRERPKWKSRDFSNPKPPAARAEPTARPEWKPRSSSPPSYAKASEGKQAPGPQRGSRAGMEAHKPSSPERNAKPEWKPKSSGEKPEWKPRGASTDRPAWKPKGAGDRPAWKGRDDSRAPVTPEWKSKGAGDRPAWKSSDSRRTSPHAFKASSPERGEKLGWKPKSPSESSRPEWKPKGAAADGSVEKRKWIPKAEYKKLTGTEAKRDDKWRPGGEHQDPRQKYKDAKKAKWGRFKQAIRSRAKKKS